MLSSVFLMRAWNRHWLHYNTHFITKRHILNVAMRKGNLECQKKGERLFALLLCLYLEAVFDNLPFEVVFSKCDGCFSVWRSDVHN